MKRISIFSILLLFAFTGISQNSFKTKTVSIFKNGSAFIIKSGNVKTVDGKYILEDNIPQALFGTVWIYSPNNQLKGVSSFIDKVKASVKATTVLAMIQSNVDKKAKLYLSVKEEVEGTIREVTNGMVLLEAAGKWTTLSVSEIDRIDFLEKPNLEWQNEVDQRILEIEFVSKSAEQNMELMYMSNGIGWLPNYLVELTSDDEAKLTLRALMMNDAEDMEDVEVNFVVGVPNFMFAHMISPLVSAQSVAQFIAALNGQGYQNLRGPAALGNAITTQTMSYGWTESDASAFLPNNVDGALEGSSAEDMYYYNKKNVTLKKGGRAYFDILRTDVAIKHIYEVNINQNSLNQGYYNSEYSFSGFDKNKVFHSIKITNDSKNPFTTGTALVMTKANGVQKPVSQDRLNYTPVKGESVLKLTQSPDIKANAGEKEISRVEKSKRIRSTNYDLLTIQGEIKVKNYKDKKIDLNVKRNVIGHLKETNYQWLKNTRIQTGYHGLNRLNEICWELELKPGEEQTVKYTYEVYVYTGY